MSRFYPKAAGFPRGLAVDYLTQRDVLHVSALKADRAAREALAQKKGDAFRARGIGYVVVLEGTAVDAALIEKARQEIQGFAVSPEEAAEFDRKPVEPALRTRAEAVEAYPL